MRNFSWQCPISSENRHHYEVILSRTDERGHGRPKYNQDEAVQGEAPEAEAVPIVGAVTLGLHVGHQPHSQRTHSRLVTR